MGHVRQLKKNGIDVIVVQFGERRGLHVISDFFEGTSVYRLPSRFQQLHFLRLLIRERPDVVHCHHVAAAVTSFLTAKILRIPHIYEAHAFWIAEREMLNVRKSVSFYRDKICEEYVLRHGNKIIVLSEKMRAEFARRGASRERMHILYPCADLEQFNERNATDVNIDGLTEGDLIVMYTGNFQPWQGLGILLESVPLVIKAVPKVKFVIVGGRKGEIAKEKERVREFADKVIFVEKLPYELMPRYMSKADILVLPRPNSPVNQVTPSKLGEYLSMGKAVVATDVGDFRRILVDNECGIVTQPTGESFAKGLIRVLKDEGLRRKLSTNAQKVASTFFNWNKAVDELIGIYESLRSS